MVHIISKEVWLVTKEVDPGDLKYSIRLKKPTGKKLLLHLKYAVLLKKSKNIIYN